VLFASLADPNASAVSALSSQFETADSVFSKHSFSIYSALSATLSQAPFGDIFPKLANSPRIFGHVYRSIKNPVNLIAMSTQAAVRQV